MCTASLAGTHNCKSDDLRTYYGCEFYVACIRVYLLCFLRMPMTRGIGLDVSRVLLLRAVCSCLAGTHNFKPNDLLAYHSCECKPLSSAYHASCLHPLHVTFSDLPYPFSCNVRCFFQAPSTASPTTSSPVTAVSICYDCLLDTLMLSLNA